MKNKKILLKSKPEDTIINNLADELNINKVLAQILIQRGINNYDEAKDFLRKETILRRIKLNQK